MRVVALCKIKCCLGLQIYHFYFVSDHLIVKFALMCIIVISYEEEFHIDSIAFADVPVRM